MSTTTGYIADANFHQVTAKHYIYKSPAPERMGRVYDLDYINHKWVCNCPDKRSKIKAGSNDRCKHERALCQLVDEQINQTEANRQAQEITECVDERAKYQAAYEQIHRDLTKSDAHQAEMLEKFNARRDQEIAALRAEVGNLRGQLDAIQSQPTPMAQIAPYLSDILAEIEKLHKENDEIKAENAEIKRVMKTKATARKKHQTETESAQIKQDINIYLDDAVESAKAAIYAAEATRERLASLEAIPHELKAELDSWTERGREELQPDYKAPDYIAPEIKAATRAIKEEMAAKEKERKAKAAKIEEQWRERCEKAPLNGNDGFHFWN